LLDETLAHRKKPSAKSLNIIRTASPNQNRKQHKENTSKQEFRRISQAKETSPKLKEKTKEEGSAKLCMAAWSPQPTSLGPRPWPSMATAKISAWLAQPYLSRAKAMAKHGDGQDPCTVSSNYLSRTKAMATAIHHRIDLAILSSGAMPRPTPAMATASAGVFAHHEGHGQGIDGGIPRSIGRSVLHVVGYAMRNGRG
jgi:hypothetical protein